MSLRMMSAADRDRAQASLNSRWTALRGHLDERARRLWLGAEARDLGYGGVAFVASATGAARDTIKLGVAELDGDPLDAGRVRREGAGRKKAGQLDPGLASRLEALVEPGSRGDPMTPLRWTTKSLVNLSAELRELGHPAGPTLIARLLRALGYSLQANAKTHEGRQHHDRDGQFRHINALTGERIAAGEPVISIDAKKKELVGNYKNGGAEWRPAGDPLPVDAYDFIGEGGKVTPYGIYDIAANRGWMTVGISADTAQFAVSSLRTWWSEVGQAAYPQATTLTITADCGGSNSNRGRLWKTELARFADDAGLAITVLHYPPGTSKWNKIEHRMFSFVSMNWRARPLTSLAVIISTIGAVTTKRGLTIEARLDPATYQKGIKITDKDMKAFEARRLDRHQWHPEWNYTIRPITTPGNQP